MRRCLTSGNRSPHKRGWAMPTAVSLLSHSLADPRPRAAAVGLCLTRGATTRATKRATPARRTHLTA
jgi:hypothetical protein